MCSLKLLAQPEIFFAVLIAVIGNCTIGMIEPLVPFYLHDTFHQNILQQGLIFTTTTVTYLICTPVAGVLNNSYPHWMCLSMGLFGLSLGLGLLYASTTVTRVCIALLFIGGGMSFIDAPALPLLTEIVVRVCYITVLYYDIMHIILFCAWRNKAIHPLC